MVELSLLDLGTRRLAGFGDDQLLVTIPFQRMIGIMQALDGGVGAACEHKRESAEQQIEEPGGVKPV